MRHLKAYISLLSMNFLQVSWNFVWSLARFSVRKNYCALVIILIWKLPQLYLEDIRTTWRAVRWCLRSHFSNTTTCRHCLCQVDVTRGTELTSSDWKSKERQCCKKIHQNTTESSIKSSSARTNFAHRVRINYNHKLISFCLSFAPPSLPRFSRK